jgi:hypothetical protein
MKNAFSKFAASAAIAVVCIAAGPAAAHHSYAMFDRTKMVTVNGAVTNFEWAAPHIYVWVKVVNAKGGSDLWGMEGGSPTSLAHNGWTRNSVKVGDKVTVDLRPLKDGRNGGYLVKITKDDGSVVGDTSSLKE